MRKLLIFTVLPLAVFAAACGDDDSGTTTPPGDTDNSETDTDTANPAVTCTGTTCRVRAGDITSNVRFSAANEYVLQGGVFIKAPATLTIEAGTKVFGDTGTLSFLVIDRGAKIDAQGTKEKPIVFTSAKNVGARAPGDWGGVIINGRAPINSCGPTAPPTGCEAQGEGSTGAYGGTDPADDSGVLRYVRIEFAGKLITAENELNGLALQGVGNKTRIEYVQIHKGADDGLEFFGGTVNVKYVLLTGANDDSLDWTDGWVGKAQFVVIQQYDGDTDNGIEADNRRAGNDFTPRSNPTISNITIIGRPENAKSNNGILLREGTDGKIWNALVSGFKGACLDVDNDATFARIQANGIELKRTVLSCATQIRKNDEKTGDQPKQDPLDLTPWFTSGTGNAEVAFTAGTDANISDPYNLTTPNFAPKAGSAAATSGEAPADSFFTPAAFHGGVDPANDWTKGWTTTEAN